MQKNQQTNRQTIGPVSTFELSKLKEFFDLNQIPFETEVDPELKIEADRQMQLHGNGEYNALTRRTTNLFDYNNAQFLYVSIPTSEAVRATTLLNQLSLSFNRDSLESVGVSDKTADELLAAEDYMCLECDFHSLESGLCPKHGVQLLPYFDWVQAKKEKDSATGLAIAFNTIFASPLVGYVVIGFAVGVVGFFIYRMIASQ